MTMNFGFLCTFNTLKEIDLGRVGWRTTLLSGPV